MRRTLTAMTLAAALAVPTLGHAQGVLNMDREEMLGSVIGASVGALLGSRVGDGDNELIGAALGGVGGYFVGKHYGNRYDRRDDVNYGRHDGYHRQPSGYRHDRHRRHGGYHGHGRRHDRVEAPTIRVVDQPFRARVDSHVRRGPAPGYPSVDVLRRGARVHVVGRVIGSDWFMVSQRGRVIGYVYAPLLDPVHYHTQYRRNR